MSDDDLQLTLSKSKESNLSTFLSGIKQRLERSTPGPWIKRPLDLYQGGVGYEIVSAAGEDVLDNQTYYPRAPNDTDAALIASAPTDLALAVEAIEVMREALEWYANCDEERTSEYAIAGLDKCARGALAKIDALLKGSGE